MSFWARRVRESGLVSSNTPPQRRRIGSKTVRLQSSVDACAMEVRRTKNPMRGNNTRGRVCGRHFSRGERDGECGAEERGERSWHNVHGCGGRRPAARARARAARSGRGGPERRAHEGDLDVVEVRGRAGERREADRRVRAEPEGRVDVLVIRDRLAKS